MHMNYVFITKQNKEHKLISTRLSILIGTFVMGKEEGRKSQTKSLTENDRHNDLM